MIMQSLAEKFFNTGSSNNIIDNENRKEILRSVNMHDKILQRQFWGLVSKMIDDAQTLYWGFEVDGQVFDEQCDTFQEAERALRAYYQETYEQEGCENDREENAIVFQYDFESEKGIEERLQEKEITVYYDASY